VNGHTSDVTSIAFTHDGAFIVSGSHDATIRVWNVETGIEAGEPLRDHTDCVSSVACSPDGVHIVSASWDYSVRLWDIADVLAKGVIGQEHDNSATSSAPLLDDTVTGTPFAKGNGTISHPRPDVAAQYPRLFPHQTFNIRDGWVRGPNDEPLLWVPPANRADLLSSSSRSRIVRRTPSS
jgi:WD40 repeat protein